MDRLPGDPVDGRMTLTVNQREVYTFLRLFVRTHGVCPSHREICAGYINNEKFTTKTRWPSTVNRILGQLEKRGWIEREKYEARAIRFL